MIVYERLQREPEEYVAELTKAAENSPDDIDVLQTLCEVHFELGNAEQAMPLLQKAMQLDPAGKHGPGKFLWAGQMFGNRRGIEYYTKGIDVLLKSASEADRNAAGAASAASTAERNLVKLQLSQAYLGMIEIWMTDLCMEPEAEQSCERLIAEALMVNESNPEAWSILGSIRISQLRQAEAKEALERAWDLFGEGLVQHTLDHAVIPQLVRLAQSMLELELYEQVLEVTGELHRLDDQVPDLYYLNALCHKNLVDTSTDKLERSKHIVAVQDAVQLLETVEDEIDPEMLAAARELLATLPAPEVENPFADEDMVELVDNDEA